MKKFIMSMAIAVFISVSIVSVAYPGFYERPKYGSKIKLCVSCWPEVMCAWDPCTDSVEAMMHCHLYSAIVPWNGGCCDHASCIYIP